MVFPLNFIDVKRRDYDMWEISPTRRAAAIISMLGSNSVGGDNEMKIQIENLLVSETYEISQ